MKCPQNRPNRPLCILTLLSTVLVALALTAPEAGATEPVLEPVFPARAFFTGLPGLLVSLTSPSKNF